MRRQDGGTGRGARGHDQTQVTPPGGAGPRPGKLGCPARSSLTAWAQRGFVPGGVLAESADRTSSDAAMERREAPAFLKRECGYCKTGAPLGAPSPRFVEGH